MLTAKQVFDALSAFRTGQRLATVCGDDPDARLSPRERARPVVYERHQQSFRVASPSLVIRSVSFVSLNNRHRHRVLQDRRRHRLHLASSRHRLDDVTVLQ